MFVIVLQGYVTGDFLFKYPQHINLFLLFTPCLTHIENTAKINKMIFRIQIDVYKARTSVFISISSSSQIYFQYKFHDWISLKTFQFAIKSVKCRADSQQVLVCLLRLSDKREMLLNKYLLNLQGWFFYFCTKTNENINTISILIIEQIVWVTGMYFTI